MNQQTLSAHVLRALAQAQIEGRVSNLETLVEALRVRRADVRAVLSSLHREGYLNVLRMRLTLAGFALGRAYLGEQLPELRTTKVAPAAAA